VGAGCVRSVALTVEPLEVLALLTWEDYISMDWYLQSIMPTLDETALLASL